ncbi:hypothetical protein MRX96_022731 [Rhipicephalus microplus]
MVVPMKTRGPPCGAATFSHWNIPVAAELDDGMTKSSVKSFEAPCPSGRAAGRSLKARRPGCRKSGDRRFRRREAADTGPLENCTLSTASLGP